MNLQPTPPTELQRLLEAATEAEEKRDFERSFELLESASRLSPSNGNVLINLGSAYIRRYEYELARKNFEKAVEVSVDKGQALSFAGSRCYRVGHFEMAEDFFERATEQKIVSPGAYVGLMEIYWRQNRFEEVALVLGRALKADAYYPPTLLIGARLDRMAGEWAKARRTLERILQMAKGKIPFRAEVLCELGAILDGQGDYDGAMAACVEAKSMLRLPERVFAAQRRLQGHASEMEANISAMMFRRWADAAEELGPAYRVAAIGGHYYNAPPTVLDQCLDSKPEIAYVEESRIFLDEIAVPIQRGLSPGGLTSAALDSMSGDALRQMREDYFRDTESLTREKIGERMLVEKKHLLNLMAPVLIRVFPETRMLVSVRDPRDACLSAFMLHMPINACSSSFLSLEGAVKEQIATLNFWRIFMSRMANPFLEVRYEALTGEPESTCRRVLNFLGVKEDANAVVPGGASQQSTVPAARYNPIAPIFAKPGHWRNYQKYLEPHLKKLEPMARAFGYE